MNRYVPILSLLVVCITLFLLPHESHAASIIRAPNNLGLVGYWSFDEGRGTQVSDLSGNANDGTLTFGPTWIPGKSGGGLELLSTSNQHVLVPNSSSLQVTGDLTISAWVKLTNNNDYGGIVSKGSGNEYEIAADFRGGERRLSWRGGSSGTGTNLSGFFSGHVGKWVHVVTVVDGTTLTAYRNGEEFGTLTVPSRSPKSTDVSIGRRTAESYAINGSIDEVRIYSRGLSSSEVQTLYNNTKGVVVGTTAHTYTDGLVAHYTFDGGTISGATVRDVAGSNDGTIYGATPAIGRIGQALVFDGVDDHVSMGDAEALDFGTEDFSYCFWVKTEDTSGQPVGKGVWGYSAWGTYISSGQVRFELKVQNPPGFLAASNSEVINDGVWHHVCGVYDRGGNLAVYTDGSLTSTASMAHLSSYSVNNSAPFVIGNGNPGRFEGYVDEVRIYNRVLSPEEIRGLAGSSIATLQVAPITGSILMERWEDIGVSGIVSSIPLEEEPDHIEQRYSLEAPANWGDAYGIRMRGYLHPKETGSYTFWIASDNQGQLWLSTDEKPSNKVLIGSVSSYTTHREWDRVSEPNQKSVEIPLVAGKRYYIEALMKEANGGDNLSVSWKLNDTTNPPNGSSAFIVPGDVLAPWIE